MRTSELIAALSADPIPEPIRLGRRVYAARLFIDFILSLEGNTLLNHDIFNVYSPRADVPTPDRQLPYGETKPLLPQDLADYEQASAKFPEHFDSFFKA